MTHKKGGISPQVISVDGVPTKGGQPTKPQVSQKPKVPKGFKPSPVDIRRQIAGQNTGGLQFGADLTSALKTFKPPKLKPPNAEAPLLPTGAPTQPIAPVAPIPPVAPIAPVTGGDVLDQRAGVKEDVFATAEERVSKVFEGREGDVTQIADAIRGLGDLRTSAFDKLFGDESRISRFFAPSIQAVEEQILDTEELLSTLRGDITERLQDTTASVTQAQFRGIEAKERGALVDQLDKLVRANTRLRAGLDIQLQLSDKEFNNVIQGAQENIDALTFSLEQGGLADEQQISLIRRSLESDLQITAAEAAENRQIASEIRSEQRSIEAETKKEAEKRAKEIEDILLSAQDFAVKAGVIPGDNFKKVIDDVSVLAANGVTTAEIQLRVLQAIGENSQVRAFITKGFNGIKSGGGKGGGGKGGGGAAVVNEDNNVDTELDALLKSLGVDEPFSLTETVLGTTEPGKELIKLL